MPNRWHEHSADPPGKMQATTAAARVAICGNGVCEAGERPTATNSTDATGAVRERPIVLSRTRRCARCAAAAPTAAVRAQIRAVSSGPCRFSVVHPA